MPCFTFAHDCLTFGSWVEVSWPSHHCCLGLCLPGLAGCLPFPQRYGEVHCQKECVSCCPLSLTHLKYRGGGGAYGPSRGQSLASTLLLGVAVARGVTHLAALNGFCLIKLFGTSCQFLLLWKLPKADFILVSMWTHTICVLLFLLLHA